MTGKTAVLCTYDLEVSVWGWIISGGKMIFVESKADILPEFERQMKIDVQGDIFWPRKIKRWRLTSYLPAAPLE